MTSTSISDMSSQPSVLTPQRTPEYLRILDHLLNSLGKPYNSQNQERSRRYNTYIREEGGTHRLRSTILDLINPEFIALLQSNRFTLKSLLQIQSYEPSDREICTGAVYLHVIWNESGVAGVYVGQSCLLRSRISKHKSNRRIFQRAFADERDISKHKRLPSDHIKFWVLNGTHDTWLKFAQLSTPTTAPEQHRERLLLTIIEQYAATVLHTLPQKIRPQGLPSDCQVEPYPWAGLNVYEPLKSLRGTVKPNNNSSKRLKMASLEWNPNQEFWRHRDVSLGDPHTVQVVCG